MEAIQYKCPNCGGELKFDPGKQQFGCEYCRSLFSEAEIKQVCKENEETDLSRSPEELQQEQEFAEHSNLYECGSCGAQVVADDNTAAAFCYYCHNPVILKGRLSGEYKPGKVLPFKITKEEALHIFSGWCKKRWFLPRAFKEKQNLEKITGLYVPFWVADCNVHADLNAIGKQVKTWRSGDYRYTHTKEFAVRRMGQVGLDGIPLTMRRYSPSPCPTSAAFMRTNMTWTRQGCSPGSGTVPFRGRISRSGAPSRATTPSALPAPL